MKNDYKGKNVLLIGGFGFVGKHLIKKLQELEANPVVVALPNKKNTALSQELGCESALFDPTKNFSELEPLLKKADIIINLIQGRKDDLALHKKVISLNLDMLGFCVDNEINPVFVHFGTRLQYSSDNKLPIDESGNIGPATTYGFAKMISEECFSFFNRKHRINTVCLRISNIYGPNDCLGGSVVDTIINSAVNSEIRIDKDPERLKDLIYIDDLIEAVILCMNNRKCFGKIINIGSGIGIKLIDIAKTIKKAFNSSKEIKLINTENKADFSFVFDISRIKDITGWSPKTTLEQGLAIIKEKGKKE